MNEIVEMIYQWHQGAGFKSIRRSLGFDRNTIRKYVTLAQSVGVSREGPFPAETELVESARDEKQKKAFKQWSERSEHRHFKRILTEY
jgi:transposase